MLADQESLLVNFLEQLTVEKRSSSHTVANYQRDIRRLQNFCSSKAIEQWSAVTQNDIRSHIASRHRQGIGSSSLQRELSAIRSFYGYLLKQRYAEINPAQYVKAPKQVKKLPKTMDVDQVKGLLEAGSSSILEVRDLAMFELFYSSGLRLSDLVNLDFEYVQGREHTSSGWINLADREVNVLGKGGKRRSVPVGAQAIVALNGWIASRHALCRPQALAGDAAALFLGERGRRISPRVVQLRLARVAQLAGLPTHVHPHVLRHSFASHVLQSAQDLRAVQEMLGHANISTTQLYTRLDFQHLARAYDAAHPRAGRKS